MLVYQAGTLLIVIMVLIPFGRTVVVSGLLGGAIALGSSLIMFFSVFKPYRAQQPERILAKFYGAEIAKLIFAMVAFALIVINVKPLSFLTLILVYFMLQVLPVVIMNDR